MDRRSYLKTTLTLGCCALVPPGVLALVGCSGTFNHPDLSGFQGKIMGTGYSVLLDSPVKTGLPEAVHSELAGIDRSMSTWRSDSELTAFNRSDDGEWWETSSAIIEVVATGLDTSEKTQSAFDVTVGPLVNLWGFGPSSTQANSHSRFLKPSNRDIASAMARMGSETFEIDIGRQAIRKLNTETHLDLSGIAKGYAVDRVTRILTAEGFRDFLVEIGGEIRTRGYKPDGTPWRVAIEHPSVGRRDAFQVVNLENHAIATSGDYRHFFKWGGQRYSHVIDPRTGMPANHDLASVSIVAESTMIADALSTAMMIMGSDAALAYASDHRIAVHLIVKKGNSLQQRVSPEFESILV